MQGFRDTMAEAVVDAHVLGRFTSGNIAVVIGGIIAMDPKPYEKRHRHHQHSAVGD